MSIYGIDLGTTNSLIGLQETNYLSEMVPSCVNTETGIVGAEAFNDMKAHRSFKVDMSMGIEGITPKVCSTHVLRELRKVAGGSKVIDVVVSVPAYFSDNQRQATIKSAEDAGLNVMGLVNEPTAAAMYIAQERKSLFVVYDLGGGTFDVSIIDARFGAYDVQATSGDIVGGDDLDRSILAYFAKKGTIPLHKISAISRSALQHFSCSKKIEIQKAKSDIKVDLTPWQGKAITFTVADYKQLVRLTFDKTVTILKRLINAFIQPSEKFEILLVGGSTRCPYLREWLEEETNTTIPAPTYDPDRVVAQGAALYAHILETNSIDSSVSDVTRALSIAMADGTCSTIVDSNSKIPLSMEQVLCNNTASDKLSINLMQGESTFASENECIGTLTWDYGETKQPNEGTVFVTIDIDNKGIIKLSVRELLKKAQVVVLDRKTALVK